MVTSSSARALLRPLLTAVVLTAVLAGCSSGGSAATPEASPSPSSTAGADAEVTAWAGEVCTSVNDLKTSINGLASAAVAGGGDVAGALATQVATITASATSLVDTVTAVPTGGENDPQLSAIKASAEEMRTSIDAVGQSVTAVQGAGEGLETVAALAGVAAAAQAALTALTATTQAIQTAAQDKDGPLGQAFAANPTCATLTS